MTELYETHAGKVKVVADYLRNGGTNAENIVLLLNDYRAQFAYKCKETFCPSADRNRPTINGNRYVGFATREALEQHRLVDHTSHDLSHVTYNILQHPWYICQCGHYSHLTPEEAELYEQGKWTDKEDCQERKDHLRAAGK